MKKRLIALFVTLLLIVGSISAQGQFPSVYNEGYMGLDGGRVICFFQYYWGEIVSGTPGQCLGLKAPGAKKIISTITRDSGDDDSPKKSEYELYPNGLMKCAKDVGVKVFNYDTQWRLQNIMNNQGNGELICKYVYDKNNRLVKCIEDGANGEYIYKYEENNALAEMTNNVQRYFFNNDKFIKEFEMEGDYFLSLTYDQQGRWTGYVEISPDYDECTYKTQVIFNYKGNEVFPSSITKRYGEFDLQTKKNVGTQYTNTYQSTFIFDSKGNWTKWKVKKLSGNLYDSNSFTITRTITYYTDDEVKKAVAELEQARKGSVANGKQEKEDLWEF